MLVHFFYVGGALLWNALAAAAYRRAGDDVPSLDRRLAYAVLALTLLGLPWVTLSGPASVNSLLFTASLALPAALGLGAWQAARRARAGQPEAWILAAAQLFLAYALVVRWGWEAGLDAGALGAAFSISYAGFQGAAFAPALWLPQFVQVPWLVRPARPRGGAAAFAWWLGLAFAGLSLVLSLAGLPKAVSVASGWYGLASAGERSADSLLRATRLPVVSAGQGQLLDTDLEAHLTELRPDAVSIVVMADAVVAGELGGIDAGITRQRAAGRRVLLTLIGPSEWYRRGVPADTLDARLDLAHAAAMAARRWQPDWLFPVGEANLLTLLSAPGDTDSARAWRARHRLQVISDSVRLAAPGVRLGIGGFEPWEGGAGADAYAAARAEVFRWAAGRDSAFDAVGLVLHAGYDDPSQFEERLAAAATHLAGLTPGKRAWVIECAGSPGVSGPLPQARHLHRVLAWAASQPKVAGVCQTALVDGPERAGLVSFLGRRRPAFSVFQTGAVGRP